MSRWEGFEELVEVVHCGSFSAAARKLGVSKGHVSQQISRLEDRLNTRLLHRTTRKVSLTETGAVYYQQCRQVVEDLVAAEHEVTMLQQEARGLLRISAPHLIAEVLLIPAIAQFLEHNPKLDIDLQLASHKVDLVEERFDLSIEVGARTDSSVINKKLSSTFFHVVASPGYFEKHPLPLVPEDLKQHRCLLFVDSGHGKPWKFKARPDVDKDEKNSPRGKNDSTITRRADVVSVAVDSHWRSNSGHALRSAALQGLGIAYLPDYYLSDHIINGSLVTVLEDWQSIERQIVAVYAHRRHLSAKLRLFTDFLSHYFKAEYGSLYQFKQST